MKHTSWLWISVLSYMLGSFQLNFWGPPYECHFIRFHIIQILKTVCSVTHTNIYSHFLSQKPHPTFTDLYTINNGDYDNEIIFLATLIKPNYQYT
jgi:hypothetical protein